MEMTETTQALARDLAEKGARPRSAKYKPQVYAAYKCTAQTGGPRGDRMAE